MSKTEEQLPETEEPLTEQDEAEREKYDNSKRKTRSWWIKTILLLLLVVLSVVMLFTLGDYISGEETKQLSVSELFATIDYPLLALLLGVIVLYITVESGKYAYMLKVYTGKFRFKIALKTMFLGKYYDGITPLSTGGQPFQMYYLHKKKVPRGAANAVPILRYLVSSFFITALAIVLLILTPRFVEQSTVNLTVLIISWVSLVINVLAPLTVALFSIFPNISRRVIVGVVGLLAKLRIVKNKEKTSEKFVRELTEYSAAVRMFMKELYKFIPLLVLCAMECLLFVTIPFFVVIAIANVPPTVELAVQIACLVIISRYTALLIPTPGNTGALEAASSIVFVTVTGINAVIGWVILVWRFFTYYVYILTGIGINIFEIIRSAIRTRREK